MKLTLNNFRQWQNFELELPSTGMIRLSGPSGAGKSTVMSAITWALFGNAATRNVTPLGGKGGMVSLDAFGMAVVRAKGPERLSANDKCDGEAQALIESSLGMSWDQFRASSYIMQKMQGSLLSLAPAEQLRFVQKLAFGSDDPEVYRTKVYAVMKSAEEELAKIEASIEPIQQQLDNLRANIAGEDPIQTDNIAATIESNKGVLKVLEEEQAKRSSQRAQLQKKISEWNKELQSPIRALPAERVRLAALVEERSALNQSLGDKKPLEDLDPIKGKQAKVAAQRAWLSNLRTVQARTPFEYAALENEKIKVFAQIANIQGHVDACRQHVSRLDKDIQLKRIAMKTLVCPHCGGHSRFEKDALVVSVPPNAQEIADLEAEKTQASESVVNMTADLKRLQQAESDLNSVKPPPAPNIMTEEKLVAAQKLVDAELSRIMQANADAQTHNARIDTLTNELNTLRMQLSTIDATLAKASLAPTNVLLAQIETAQAEIDAMVSLDEASTTNRQALVSTIDSLNLQLVKATKRQYIESQIKTLEGDLKIRVAKSEEVRSRHTAAVRLKGLSDLSATDAVAAILGAVNVNTKIYLDMLFPGEGTSVQILNTKENKNGTQAAKLSVKIIHKGAQFDSIDDLSGGESSRVQLAVQLAVGDLFNSPILLLDEAFAGVNGELRDECLMALRAVGEKRLVLVSEHNVQDGLFDDVIDFSK